MRLPFPTIAIIVWALGLAWYVQTILGGVNAAIVTALGAF